jgi:hypothetical protein
VLGGIGLANGVIDARIFVAMVVMTLVTSMRAGPIMNRLLGTTPGGPRAAVPAVRRE